MLILGIESSCDDTSVALLDCSKQGHIVLFEKTASQIGIHKKYGGVVPEIAGRMHAEKIVPLIEAALSPSPITKGGRKGVAVEKAAESAKDGKPHLTSPWKGEGTIRPDAIAVTAGPGLITGLLVGVEAARTLSYALDIPLIRTNHIEGHIYSVEILNPKSEILNKSQISKSKILKSCKLQAASSIQFPALALIVSGGHTELILMKNYGKCKLLGATKDDAAGECFDKVAKLLGLPYPGGPQISKLAEIGNPNAINFPRPMIKEENYLFSFAGLKTSALYWLRDNSLSPLTKGGRRGVAVAEAAESIAKDGTPPLYPSSVRRGSETTINDFCASFEQAIVDVLVSKTIKAAAEYKPKTIILAGGVSANKKLRQTLVEQAAIQCPKSKVRFPKSEYCMDNAAMIAAAGYYHANKKDFTSWRKIQADPNWELAK
jgi:N6-L-threonylcarbamoyladenine synthase